MICVGIKLSFKTIILRYHIELLKTLVYVAFISIVTNQTKQ